MQAEPIPQAVGETSDTYFRPGVLSLYARHLLAALGGRERIHLVPAWQGEIEIKLPLVALGKKSANRVANYPRDASLVLIR